jgi:hypothetical protein
MASFMDLPKDIILLICTKIGGSAFFALKKSCSSLYRLCNIYQNTHKIVCGSKIEYLTYCAIQARVRKSYMFNHVKHGPEISYFYGDKYTNKDIVYSIEFWKNDDRNGISLCFSTEGELEKLMYFKNGSLIVCRKFKPYLT